MAWTSNIMSPKCERIILLLGNGVHLSLNDAESVVLMRKYVSRI